MSGKSTLSDATASWRKHIVSYQRAICHDAAGYQSILNLVENTQALKFQDLEQMDLASKLKAIETCTFTPGRLRISIH
jgi:hypothetical protein